MSSSLSFGEWKWYLGTIKEKADDDSEASTVKKEGGERIKGQGAEMRSLYIQSPA